MNKEKMILKNYVEGRLTTREFWEIYKSNPKISKLLLNDKTAMFKTYYSPGIIESHFNIDDVFERYGLYENIKAYFIRNKIDCEFKNEDEEYISLIKKIQPKYVDIRDVQFWNTIISESPEFSKKQEKIRFFKNLMIEKFSYEQKPPRWLQAPEWPLDNNIPLKFIKQQSIESGMKYYFYNTKTKETKIIEQFN